MSSTAIVSAACGVCHDAQQVPDPTLPGGWMACPECCDTDLEPAAAAFLPLGPVGRLDLWAVSADESQCVPHAQTFGDVETASLFARVWLDGRLPRVMRLAGGEVRVCDEAGNVWERVPIPAPTAARAAA